MGKSQGENGVVLTKAGGRPGSGIPNGHKDSATVDVEDVVPTVSVVNGKHPKQNGSSVVDENKDGVHDDEEETERGCCGRAKKKQDRAVGTTELFKFSTPVDKFLMLLGTIGAIAMGTAMPINIATFGDVIGVFVDDSHSQTNLTANSTSSNDRDLVEAMLPYIYRFIGIGVGTLISGWFAVCCWQWAAERQISTMRKKFFYSVMSQEIGWFDIHEAGEISSRFSEDVNKISEGMGDKMAIFLQWSTTWIASYIMAFIRSWKLTLAMIIFSPLLIIIGAFLVRVMRRMAAQEAKSYAKAGAVAEQAFRAIRTVQAFQGQEKESKTYEDNLTDAVKVASKKGVALGLGHSSLWLLLFIMFACVMWFGTFLLQSDSLSPADVLPVFLGIMIGSFSMGNAFNNLEGFSNARGAAAKVFDIIALQSTIDAFSEEGKKPQTLQGNIEFRNVKFRYPARPDVVVLSDFILSIKPGEHVALVGPSGCGKSTTVQLLQRFYDPEGGSVSVDGHNIKDLNLKWFREHIGVVSQEPSLFDATVEENIRFGRMDATEQEIHQAAKEANAHDFIKQLPQGYKTNVGERGAQLSGGQKQRISIARALVRNPKILLLDEATSALDHESESIVQDALEKAEKGRTTITIAHRLSTVKRADKIVAISDGEVIEQGSHNELMEANGLYHQLVEIQSKLQKESELVTLEEAISLLSLRSMGSGHNPEDIADVEIVEEDEGEADAMIGDKELMRTSFKRQSSVLSGTSAERRVSLVAMPSNRKKKRKLFKKGKDTEEKPAEEKEETVKLSEIMRYNAPEWPLITLGGFAAIVSGCIQPAFSFVLSEYIKYLGIQDEDEQWEKVTIVASIVIGVAIVSAIVNMLQGYCFSKSGAYLTARLRKATFDSLINQDMEYFDHPSNQVGCLTTKLSGDAALVQGATGSKIGQVLQAVATIVCAIIIAFVFGWKLAFVMLSFAPFMVAAGIVQGRVIAGAATKEKSQLQQAGKICSEVVDSIRTVVSLGREEYYIQKFNGLIDYTKSSSMKMSIIFGLSYGIANSLIFFAYAVAFYYGSTLVADGEMEFYDVFRVFAAIIFGGMMVGRQSSFGADYSKARLAGTRIINLINRKPKIDVRETEGNTLNNFKGSISFTNAGFHYPLRPKVAVLDQMNLVVNPGETVALVGASGCGKSTSVQLIERFYDLDSGSLLVEGQDIKSMNLSWYRRQLGIVSQEPTLFDCSIAENIAYGDNTRVVPMDEIIQAAKDANIHTFISSLPQGYDTSVGDKGTQLSGGQKQRIAIARALVRNPKVLLLDEATSALDTESEKIVQEALDRASEHRTCVTIAHRLSTIRNADKIAVVSKGKIVEIGTHAQLMTIKGAYYRLLRIQNGPHK